MEGEFTDHIRMKERYEIDGMELFDGITDKDFDMELYVRSDGVGTGQSPPSALSNDGYIPPEEGNKVSTPTLTAISLSPSKTITGAAVAGFDCPNKVFPNKLTRPVMTFHEALKTLHWLVESSDDHKALLASKKNLKAGEVRSSNTTRAKKGQSPWACSTQPKAEGNHQHLGLPGHARSPPSTIRMTYSNKTATVTANKPTRDRRPEPDQKVWVEKTEVTAVDILSDRGGHANKHNSNNSYQKIKLEEQPGYKGLPLKEKAGYRDRVIKKIHDSGARFLKWDVNAEKYYIQSKKAVEEKMSQALREDHTTEGRAKKLARQTKNSHKETPLPVVDRVLPPRQIQRRNVIAPISPRYRSRCLARELRSPRKNNNDDLLWANSNDEEKVLEDVVPSVDSISAGLLAVEKFLDPINELK